MSTIYSALTLSLIYSSPIIIAGLGGLYSEKSGVTNVALEGLMLMGAFGSAASIVFLEQVTSLAPWIAILIGALMGGLLSLIHAYASVKLKANQVISGTGINLLAAGITVYLCQIIFNQQRTTAFSRGFTKMSVPVLSKIPFIGDIFFSNIYPTVYIGFLLVIITWYVMKKTRFGLRIRACGENPHAADSLGINVLRVRFISVLISGLLAGLAGAIMVLTQDTQFTATTIHGMGFIALATLVFGKWNPFGVLGAGTFFGLSQIIRIYANSFPVLASIPQEIFFAFPYVITILALIIFKGKGNGPKANGIPYDQGARS